jgi:6-phosphofructo-2-kinase/fructose-2,6-biphosphatase 4
MFAEHDIHTLFFESVCTDENLIRENVRNVKISSPDYFGWDPDAAVKDYLDRITAKIPHFETMDTDEHLDYIQMINAGEKYLTNNISFGYLHNRILFYLMNLHIKPRQTYFARAGKSSYEDSYKADGELTDDGREYAEKLADTIIKHREDERQALIKRGGSDAPLRKLVVWTSSRQKSIDTAAPLKAKGYRVYEKVPLSQLNPGVCESLTDDEILQKYPEEVIKHNTDPYHHRYPRAEVRNSKELYDTVN